MLNNKERKISFLPPLVNLEGLSPEERKWVQKIDPRLEINQEGKIVMTANVSPTERREVKPMSVNFQLGVGYQDESGKIHFAPLPGLDPKYLSREPEEPIFLDKRKW